MNIKDKEKWLQDVALMMAVNCVRNTVIENYHAGKSPSSKTGDYSDVKVVTPYGEIPWTEVSKISDKQMKVFNIEVANKLYTFLDFLIGGERSDDELNAFYKSIALFYPNNWNTPKLDNDMMRGIKTILKKNHTD